MFCADATEIINIVGAWSKAIDTRDFDRIGTIMKNATFVSDDGIPVSGGEVLAEFYERVLDEANRTWTDDLDDARTVVTKHVFTNHELHFATDGLSASCQYYGTVFAFSRMMPLQPRYSGRYTDEFRKISGKWELVSRLQEADYTVDWRRTP